MKPGFIQTVAEAAVRKKNKDEKTREQNAANAVSAATTAQATSISSKNGEEEPPAKAKRLGKGALKVPISHYFIFLLVGD